MIQNLYLGNTTERSFIVALNKLFPESKIKTERLSIASHQVLLFLIDDKPIQTILLEAGQTNGEVVYQMFKCKESMDPEKDYLIEAYNFTTDVINKKLPYITFFNY